MTFVACSVLIDSSRSKGLRLRLTNDSKVAATKWESVGLRCLFFLSALPSWLLACMCWRGWLKLMMTACNGRGKHKAKGLRTVVFLPSVVKTQIHCHRCEVQSVRLNRWMIGVVLFVVRCGSQRKLFGHASVRPPLRSSCSSNLFREQEDELEQFALASNWTRRQCKAADWKWSKLGQQCLCCSCRREQKLQQGAASLTFLCPLVDN